MVHDFSNFPFSPFHLCSRRRPKRQKKMRMLAHFIFLGGIPF
jgi:hypothetical protein